MTNQCQIKDKIQIKTSRWMLSLRLVTLEDFFCFCCLQRMVFSGGSFAQLLNVQFVPSPPPFKGQTKKVRLNLHILTIPFGPSVLLMRSPIAIAPTNDDRRAVSAFSSWASAFRICTGANDCKKNYTPKIGDFSTHKTRQKISSTLSLYNWGRGLSKHTLSMSYYPSIKIHPNYAFLHVFFSFPPS